MEPVISVGSICFVNQRFPFEEVRNGDIISFEVGEKMFVTHRAVRIDIDGITTKGDANNTEDSAKVTDENFIGKTIFWLPYFGKIVLFAHSVKGKIVLTDIFLLFLLASFVYDHVTKENTEIQDDDADDSGVSS